LVTDLRCGQLPDGALAGLGEGGWPTGAHLYVALDDDGARHVVQSGPRTGRRTTTRVVEGGYEATQRVGERVWRVPVTAFWQAHRDAARVYSELVGRGAQLGDGMVAWDLYGGAGIFAAVLGEAVGDSGQAGANDAQGGNLLVILAIVVLAAAFFGWRLRRSGRRIRFLPPGDRQWAMLLLAADRAGVSQRASETDYEYAGWLAGAVAMLALLGLAGRHWVAARRMRTGGAA
jgi:hypothetical protein